MQVKKVSVNLTLKQLGELVHNVDNGEEFAELYEHSVQQETERLSVLVAGKLTQDEKDELDRLFNEFEFMGDDEAMMHMWRFLHQLTE